MDRTELETLLLPFKKGCLEHGKPLKEICLKEAYPGDISTSYIVQVTAEWVDELDCSTALDFLFDVLWDTTSEKTRTKIFSIQVLDSKEQLHCQKPAIVKSHLLTT